MAKSSLQYLAIRVVLFLFLIFAQRLHSQNEGNNINQQNEITIFVIPSVTQINWSNPSDLFKSMEHCYISAFFQKNYYVIGHTIARVNAPLLTPPFYVAMSGAVQTEKIDLVLFKKVGFGALGSTISGHIEPEKSIKKGLQLYSKRNRVAYIKFKVNEHSAKRILQFVTGFQEKSTYGFPPFEKYNGSLWPRYENEGSGCSAFGMSLLDVAHLLPTESKEWTVDIKVPMNLIGGEFNNNKKISLRTILKTKSWFTGNGEVNVDYVNYKVYDPSLIFDWIIKQRSKNNPEFSTDEENGVPGLVIDGRNIVIDENEPIFKHRTDSDLFTRSYHKKFRPIVLK